MTISTTSNTVVAQGNGLTTSFSFGFPVPLASELFVYLTNAGAAPVLLSPTQYSVTGIGSQVGGAVTYPLVGSPIPSGSTLTIQRIVTYQQLTDLVNQSGYYPNVVENALDYLTMQTQQLAQQTQLSLQVPLATTPANLTLPGAAARANQLVGFDLNGNAVTYPITASVGAGNLTSEGPFVANVGFTPNVTTTLTLSQAYGTPANVDVHFDTEYQGPDQYSLSGNNIIFTSPIPQGVNKVYIVGGTTLSLYVPPNRTVGDAQLSWGNILNRVCDSITALELLNPATYTRAFVTGYSAAGDGGGGAYYYNPAISQGLANGGTIIPAFGGVGCWIMVLQARRVSALQFGAKGDGVTDDTAAINAAGNWMSSVGGGIVDLPPTGHPYLVAGQIVLLNGVMLQGAPVTNFEGMSATNAQWAQYGTWINPTSGSSCILMQGHGSAVQDINFIHVQPASTPGWTPNIYGYCIEQINDMGFIRNVRIVNASHGIWLHYQSANGGGTNVMWDNIIISAFVVRMRTTCVNDCVHFRDIDLRGLWFEGDANVIAYIMNHTIGWYCGYTDNAFVSGIQFFEDYQAIYFIDETCLGNTHSFYNGTMVNVQFNLPGSCMVVASTTTHVRGYFSDVVSQTGNAFGITWSTTQFQLGSDNVEMMFNGLTIPQAGGQVMALGNGGGGLVTISNLRVESYSSVASGQVCFSVSNFATLNLAGYYINMVAGNGVRFAGGNANNGVITSAAQARSFYSTFAQTTFPHTGSFADCSTSNMEPPQQVGYHQARLIGNVTVGTPAAGTMAFQMSTNNNIAVSGISTASPGSVSFDSGWIDILTSASGTGLGRLQSNVPAGAVVTNGDLQLQLR